MPVNSDSYYLDLYDLLKSKGYKPVPLDASGQGERTGKKDFAPQEAEVLRFNFIKDGKNYGEVWATVENKDTLVLYYDDEIMDSPDHNTSGTEFTDSFIGLLAQLKRWGLRRNLAWEPKNRTHLASDMQQRRYKMRQDALKESYQAINKRVSHNDVIPKVKIIIEHNRNLQEGEKRYHNINRIFIENTQGERFLINTKRPSVAKAFARHIAEGGTPYDEKGKHIGTLAEELSRMGGFVRATRNRQFNESALKLVEEGLAYYQNLRETLGKMVSHRGYNTYFENWTPVLVEETTEENQLNELFVRETLDPRIENVLPILSKLHKQTKEVTEVKELENWANEVINEKLKTTVVQEKIEDDNFAKTISDIVTSPNMVQSEGQLSEADSSDIDFSDQAASRRKTKAGQWNLVNINTRRIVAGPFDSQIAALKAKRDLTRPDLQNTIPVPIGENLSRQQKKAGQLGPTEKARKISPVLGKPQKKHPFQGKLVGANESVSKKRR